MTTGYRKNTSNTLKNYGGMTALAVASDGAATRDFLNHGICLPDGLIKPMPHHFFVDDNMYCNRFNSSHIWLAVVASIKAIYILLGDSNLMTRQDPVLFEKLEDMPISYSSHILGQIINTRCMDVEMPSEFIADTLRLLQKLIVTAKSSTHRTSNPSQGSLDTLHLQHPGHASSSQIFTLK